MSLHDRLARHSSALAVTSNLTSGKINSVGIRNGVFTLRKADGSEFEPSEKHLDVVILTGNPNLSKQWYEKAYDSTTGEGKLPDCWSHNGVGPSTGAANPQHATCLGCPRNQWGTATRNDGTAAKGKACSDRKLLAVIPIAHGRDVFQLAVPPASLANLFAYIRDLVKSPHASGRPMEPFDFVTRLTFDRTKTGQVLLFARGAQLDDNSLNFVADALDAGQHTPVLMLDDKPIAALPASAAPAQLAAPMFDKAPAGQGYATTHAMVAEAKQELLGKTFPAPAQERVAAAKAAAQARQTAPASPVVEAPVASGAVFSTPEAPTSDLDALLAKAGF